MPVGPDDRRLSVAKASRDPVRQFTLTDCTCVVDVGDNGPDWACKGQVTATSVRCHTKMHR
jgi:hypothetical protein